MFPRLSLVFVATYAALLTAAVPCEGPGTPGTPGTPGVPANPSNPGIPAVPGVPGLPGLPWGSPPSGSYPPSAPSPPSSYPPSTPSAPPSTPTSPPTIPPSGGSGTGNGNGSGNGNGTGNGAGGGGGAASGGSGDSSQGQCNANKVQCCDQVQPAGAPAAADKLGLLNIVLQDVNTPVGINCTPLNVLGAGYAAKCTSQAVCCENNSFSGLVAIGCTPINLEL